MSNKKKAPVTSTADPSVVPDVIIQDTAHPWAGRHEYEYKYPPTSQTDFPTKNRCNQPRGNLENLLKIKHALHYPIKDGLREDSGTVLTNHFEVDVSPDTRFWEYQIIGMSENEKRPTKKRFMRTVIENVPFLRDNQDSFATDYINTIIAWKDLHNLIKTPKIASKDPQQPGTSDEWSLIKITDRNVTCDLSFRLIRQVDIEAFKSYTASRHEDPTHFDPEPTRNALNIVITKCFAETGHVVNLNAHKFYIIDSAKELLPNPQVDAWALEAVRGYYYTIKPGMGKILLNVNPATSAFWNAQNVANAMSKEVLLTFGGDLWALKGLRVWVNYARSEDKAAAINAPHSRIKRIQGFGEAVNVQTFSRDVKDEQGIVRRETKNIAKFLLDTYRIKVDHPSLRAVNVGSASEPSWFAPEHLLILPDQIWAKVIPDKVAAAFHNISLGKADATRARIETEGLGQLASINPPPSPRHTQPVSLAKCPPIGFNPLMLQIPYTRMSDPTVTYLKAQASPQARGSWNLAGKKFLQGVPDTVTWKLILARDIHQATEDAFVRHFEKQLKETGVCKTAEHIGLQAVHLTGLSEPQIRAALAGLHKNADGEGVPQIVVLLLQVPDQQAYSAFKYLTDKIFCFQAICATEAKFKGRRGLNENSMQQYMANVAMKANLKVGGVNHSTASIAKHLENTLVIGADLTHAGNGAVENCLSIAAVVGSIDSTAGCFRGKLYLQEKSDMVSNLEEAVADFMDMWYNRNGTFPAKILYYRDGVSRGQYEQLKDEEVTAIERAWKKKIDASKPLKLTTVIVTKRHNTRFFPSNKGDAMNNQNCKPGTLVDSIVTDPYYSDFYLQSHDAIKGTARPCYYFMLTNGIGISMATLEDLTHNLCHTYVRATKGVSYAPPAYYADRLCERGRCYLRKWYSPDRDTREEWRKKKEKIQRDVQLERGRQNQKLAQRKQGDRKTEQELKDEETDEAAVRSRLEKELLPLIKKRWDQDGELAEAPLRRKAILDTMYWM